LKRYGLYILDLDGTLYRGSEVVPHAVEVVAELRRRGALIRYLTNNSGQTRSFYVEKLRGMGYDAAPEEVYSTATGVSAYCRDQGIRSAFVVGEPGLIETLREGQDRCLNDAERSDVVEATQALALLRRIEVVNAGPDGFPTPQASKQADAVVVGVCRSFTYALLDAAMQQLLQGARYVATNTDNSYPLEGGKLQPGAGTMVAAVSTCSKREPEVVVGKPNPLMVEQIAAEAGMPLSEVLCVGDRHETDLLCGINAGCDAHMVLTGVTKQPPAGVSWSDDMRGLL
jgi:4-nitrophenyl phosphatase